MNGLIQYLISITAAGILCGFVKVAFESNSASNAVIRLIAGLIMVFTVIAPITNAELVELPVLSAEMTTDAYSASTIGKEMAQLAVDSIITEELEAYILDKAASVGADIQVELRLSESCPAGIVIFGSVSPGTKQQLQQVLETDLGIAKENQQWIQ